MWDDKINIGPQFQSQLLLCPVLEEILLFKRKLDDLGGKRFRATIKNNTKIADSIYQNDKHIYFLTKITKKMAPNS